MLELPGFSRDDRPARGLGLPRLQLDPGAADDLRRGAQAAAGCSLAWRDGEVERGALRAARARRRRASAQDGPAGDLAAELRETLRDSVRAHLVADVPVGVLLSGGVDSAGLTALAGRASAGAGEDLLDRLRGGELRRARRGRAWSPSATAPTTTSWSLRPDAAELLPQLVEAFDEPFGDSSAVPTYLVSELAAGEVKVALSGRGRRRAVRRLLHLRRRPAGAAPRLAGTARVAPGRGAAQLRRQGQLRLQSEALRPRRSPAAARAPPRLEGDLLARARASLAAARRRAGWDPVDLYRERYAETAGRRAARSPPGRRPRHLPGRRPAGQDRPLEHGPLAGAARALPRPAGRRLRARPADAAQGARHRPRSGCCAVPSRRCCRRRSCAAPSRASRSRSPPGCAARWSRSPGRSSRRRRSIGRAASTRRR